MPRCALLAAVAAALVMPAPSVAAPLRLNHLQVVGTHNSFHLEPSPAELRLLAGSGLVDTSVLEYSFAPLGVQLERQDVRQLELDLFADPAGGRYAEPRLRALAGEGPADPALWRPGTKVLHVQDYDYRTTCTTLVACLAEVRAWSDRHRGHVPVAVLLELRDQPLPRPVPATVPLRWTAARMDALEAEIRAVFPRDRLIVPDDVRGRHATLERAVRRRGWPRLARSRGRVMFLLDNTAQRLRRAYLSGHPSLAGRLLFTASRPGRPDAAFVKVNHPAGMNARRIRRLVRRGYVVRTRADADTREARARDPRRRRAALASGAHWVSTDYPAPGTAGRFGSPYAVRLGRPARCNPVTAPAGCRSSRLERR